MLSNPNDYMNILDIWQKPDLIIEYYHVEGGVTDIYNTILTQPILPLRYAQVTYSDRLWYGIPSNEKYRKTAWLNRPEDMHLSLSQFIKLIDFKIQFLQTMYGPIENTFNTIIITSNLSLSSLYPQLLIYREYSHILNWIVQYHVEKVDSDQPDPTRM